MRRMKTMIVLGLATIAVIAAAVLSQKEPTSLDRGGELLFPDLMERINETGAVEAVSEGKTFSLTREEDRWVVPERSGYPAAGDQVRELLLGMAELRRVEPKTSKPELYEKLDLGDPTEEGAVSIRYAIKAGDGKTLASLTIGKRRPATGVSGASELFVRVADDPQAWLVVGKLPAHRGATAWLDKRILDIEEKRVRRVTVSHPDGEWVVVEKSTPADADFKLRGYAEYREVESQYSVNNVARALASLSLDDVKPAGEAKLADDKAVIAVLETFDGLRVTVKTTKEGDEAFAGLSAGYDPALVEKTEPAEKGADDSTGDGGDEKGADDSTGDGGDEKGADDSTGDGGDEKGDGAEAAVKSKPESVQAEVEQLNARWAGWAYRIPSYKVDDFSKKMADLVKKEEEKKEEEKKDGES